MILALLHHPLTALARVDLPLLVFWTSYLALWPAVLYWWNPI